ncbi:DoxX family membrane protein [Burkholderia sp. BCC0322]|uniref:DoxX family protein n=1 Tax=Burkholderia sp. BCC0322 TaxID=2676296 RepID=UPI00158F487C|nr:DoxX family membrane protein [Burkholderia sp. BCC0322]
MSAPHHYHGFLDTHPWFASALALIRVLARIATGIIISISGFNALVIPENQNMMLADLANLHVPFPEFAAPLMATISFAGGLMLTTGFVSRAASAILLIIGFATLVLVKMPHLAALLSQLEFALSDWYGVLPLIPE